MHHISTSALFQERYNIGSIPDLLTSKIYFVEMWYSTIDELLSEFHQYNYFILEAIWHKFVPAVVNFNEENYNWFKKCLGANMAMTFFQDSSAIHPVQIFKKWFGAKCNEIFLELLLANTSADSLIARMRWLRYCGWTNWAVLPCTNYKTNTRY